VALITNLQQIRDRERSRRARRMVAGLSLASESELLRAAVRQPKERAGCRKGGRRQHDTGQ
jgi:hypothetical protein